MLRRRDDEPSPGHFGLILLASADVGANESLAADVFGNWPFVRLTSALVLAVCVVAHVGKLLAPQCVEVLP